MHYQYITSMRGVDVADQLRGDYSYQVRTQKWWHRLFFFLFDTTVVNTWKLHCKQYLTLGNRPLSHKSFQLRLAKVLALHHLRTRKCTSRYNRHPHTVPNLLSLLPWASYAHWRMLGGGAPAHFRLKVMLINMFFFFTFVPFNMQKAAKKPLETMFICKS